MARRLYIGNLSFKVAEPELERMFSELELPLASVQVMREPASGKSRGFAFAELEHPAELAHAIEILNGKVLDGRALAVAEARPERRR